METGQDLNGPQGVGVRPELAGDHKDDDGQYIDDLFEQNPDGVDKRLATNVSGQVLPAVTYQDKPPQTTRMLSRSVPVTDSDGAAYIVPVQVFPADASRKSITVASDVRFKVASERSDLNGAALMSMPTPTEIMTGHTGALWVIAEPSVVTPTQKYVSFWVVSK